MLSFLDEMYEHDYIEKHGTHAKGTTAMLLGAVYYVLVGLRHLHGGRIWGARLDAALAKERGVLGVHPMVNVNDFELDEPTAHARMSPRRRLGRGQEGESTLQNTATPVARTLHYSQSVGWLRIRVINGCYLQCGRCSARSVRINRWTL
jgi:hypothetical protein